MGRTKVDNVDKDKVVQIKTIPRLATLLQKEGKFDVVAILGGQIGTPKKVFLRGKQSEIDRLLVDIDPTTDKPYLKQIEVDKLFETFKMSEIANAEEKTKQRIDEDKEASEANRNQKKTKMNAKKGQ